MLANTVVIEDLLPHRDDMLLIDEILEFDEKKSRTRSRVTDRWPLTDPQGAQALILIELAAQTAGINNGWDLRRRHGPEADQRGWMVGIKTARFYIDLLPLGTEVIVRTENQFAFEGFREIGAVATIEGRPAAEITLQLMQAEEM